MDPAATFDLSGLIDMHIHASPDVRGRWGDDIDTVRAAREAGLRAVLLKSHITITSDRATIAEKVVGGICVFGGLALNWSVGGLNPVAVEAALGLGARQIWMPTQDARGGRSMEGHPGGISILTAEGRIRPEVYEILELVRRAGVILGTGHLAVAETIALVRLARDIGLRKILVTHPEAAFIQMSTAAQLEVAGEGVFFERCFVATTHRPGGVGLLEQMAADIREVGLHSTVVSSDFGQAHNPAPVQGFRAYLAALAAEGFTDSEIRRMAGETPAQLLGI